MWKKVFLSISIVVFFAVGISIYNSNTKGKAKEQLENNQNIVVDEKEELSKYVTDECIDEWEDYATYVEEEIKETGSLVLEEDRIYILRLKNDIIEVYYLSDNNEEILYKTTEISAKYLPEEDAKNLEKGIRVEGIESLNKLLEDFE